MSTLEEKLQAPERPSTGRARATLEHFKKRSGVRTDLDHRKPPLLLFVESMLIRECWKLIPGAGTGWETAYELIQKTPVKGKGE